MMYKSRVKRVLNICTEMKWSDMASGNLWLTLRSAFKIVRALFRLCYFGERKPHAGKNIFIRRGISHFGIGKQFFGVFLTKKFFSRNSALDELQHSVITGLCLATSPHSDKAKRYSRPCGNFPLLEPSPRRKFLEIERIHSPKILFLKSI